MIERRGFMKSLAPLAMVCTAPFTSAKNMLTKKVQSVPWREFSMRLAGRAMFLESRGVSPDEMQFDGSDIKVVNRLEPSESDPIIEIFPDSEVDRSKLFVDPDEEKAVEEFKFNVKRNGNGLVLNDFYDRHRHVIKG